MGCDWYKVTHISGIGFIIDKNVEENYKKLLSMDSDKIDFVLFSDCATDSLEDLKVKLFVYDKKTFHINQIQIPGPYEIDLTAHCTKVDDIPAIVTPMDVALEFGCITSYLSILTTMGVGRLGKNSDATKNVKSFETMESYKYYYGYLN